VTDERDQAIVELVAAKVIELTDIIDGNGNRAYRMLKFPPGERGRKLQALFDRHIQGRPGRHIASAGEP
jgi:hypothetical protein